MRLEEVMVRWDWRPIPNCPGRYKLPQTATSPAHIVGADLPIERHRPATRDPVLIIRLDSGGLISYEQADGTFVHTLADADGFARKLATLGIE